MFNLIVGAVIFGYAGWSIYRFIKKSRSGKCAACSLKDACQTSCEK